jgi:hypothetical protein
LDPSTWSATLRLCLSAPAHCASCVGCTGANP